MNGISVITICFNNLPDVQKTCAAVDAQDMAPDEHWIINGSTEPDIANWLQHTAQPAYRKWVNERDKGIADAFNKGIAKAAGPITHLLNSGDTYASNDVLSAVAGRFAADHRLQWISGNIQVQRGGHTVTVGKPFEKSRLYRGMRSVSHPTWFVKKEVYERCGPYKSEYKIAMDYDMMCRIADEPYAYLNKTLAVFDDAGISSTQYLRSLEETRTVFESHFGYSSRLVAWQWRLKSLHHLMQTAIGKALYTLKKKAGGENW
jgi:hypothetical protein